MIAAGDDSQVIFMTLYFLIIGKKKNK